MAHLLVIGGGLSGCTVAMELADQGHEVTIIEKNQSIGGKTRSYGCKASDVCNNCGLCLTGGLWETVQNNEKINIITGSQLMDVTGSKGEFEVSIGGACGYKVFSGISALIVSIGFENYTSKSFGNLEITDMRGVITGNQLEGLLLNRGTGAIMPEIPSSVAFLQCFGSRDKQEKAGYCSRVCCGYSTRAARVLKHYYPQIHITFFYMDLQYVEAGQYFDALTEEGFEFIKCRPVKVKTEDKVRILFEQPGTGEITSRSFDYVVLSEGIHPPSDSEQIAELCTLGINNNGFLKYVTDGAKTGIYLSGCAAGPKRIEEVHYEARMVARQVISNI
jgi:heterodisulfide reductase subunit A2